jgi:quercetin dioxygenase-like cupin family protein
MAAETSIPPAVAHSYADLLGYAAHGIASRVLHKTGGGNATIFAFEKGQALSEHVSPYDAMVVVLEGVMTLTIGGQVVSAQAGTVTRMPAGIPHALDADERTRMLLIMLREPKG